MAYSSLMVHLDLGVSNETLLQASGPTQPDMHANTPPMAPLAA